MVKHQDAGFREILLGMTFCGLAACGGGGSGDGGTNALDSAEEPELVVAPAPERDPVEDPVPDGPLDTELRGLIANQGLTGDPASGRDLPSIQDPLPQLGMKLFFSKSLGGGFDSACVSCHHPVLGGADDLSLPVGVHAVEPDLLGVGREHISGVPPVPRNSPTVFNLGLWDTVLFWDGRVESLGREPGANGAASGIRTPDSPFGNADAGAGANLAAAQARFPVTSAEEMKTDAFEAGSDNDEIRAHLAGRLGDYGEGVGELVSNLWLEEFQAAFNSTSGPESLVTFDNIALALGEYERSMLFVESPWKAYVEGDNTALTDSQKRGAILFLSQPQEGGAGCSSCHSGDLFSDSSFETIAFPQIGPGKGDGNGDDFGRERETGDPADRYRFRVPSLLNVAVTAPYGHAGAYADLETVVRHYDNPGNTVDDFFDDGGWCSLQQFAGIEDCASLYPQAENNSELALRKLRREQDDGVSRLAQINLNGREERDIVAFLNALTDPCVLDRDCLAPWIADTALPGPDGQQLNAVDEGGQPL